MNLYIPPDSSCSANYSPNLTPFLPEGNSLILGDFNAHDPLWGSSHTSPRGSLFSDIIGNSNHGVLNDGAPTRVPVNAEPSCPDISLASLSILPYADWTTQTTLGSDHLPIVIKLSTELQFQHSDNKTFINFNKAKWSDFTTQTEELFSKLDPPVNVYKGERAFRKIVNRVSKICIPAGRIKTIIPVIPTTTAAKITEREELRKETPTSARIAVLDNEISHEINTHRRDKWREKVGETVGKHSSTKLFKLIKHLNGQNTHSKGNEGIKFKGKYITKPSKLADSFNKQYTAVKRHTSSKETRHISRSIRSKNITDCPKFSSTQTKDAIKKAKTSKALGPDGISNLHLKHLGPAGIQYLTHILNLSTATCEIPTIWKCSTVIPLPKPGKDLSESKSYRPVSLLCPAAKILERLMLPVMTEKLPVPEFQHGFRKQHSTVTALSDFNEAIADGFNEKKPASRTLLLQIDLSKACDTVSHNKDLYNSDLPPAYKRWLNSYLRGRQTRVKFRGKTSSSRNVKMGVPQGAVISPLLFNYYMSNLPRPPTGVFIIQYVDDISIFFTGVDI